MRVLPALTFLKYFAARFSPASVRRHLRSRKRRWAAQERTRQRAARIARHGTVDATTFGALLRDAGVKSGGVLFVQTSFNDLHTFAGRPFDLLQMLRNLVGPVGTLLMPAYTEEQMGTLNAPVDVLSLPTYTGIVNELFRRSNGVKRSIHPRHSICAEGPLASALLADHELCLYADGPDSPLDRLRHRSDAQILTLGLAPAFTSFLHWLEDEKPAALPFVVHEQYPRNYAVRLPNGQVTTVSDMQIRRDVAARLDLERLAGALKPPAMLYMERAGIDIGLYAVPSLAEQLLALRDDGIIHYR